MMYMAAMVNYPGQNFAPDKGLLRSAHLLLLHLQLVELAVQILV
jgi:hypothetical protein